MSSFLHLRFGIIKWNLTSRHVQTICDLRANFFQENKEEKNKGYTPLIFARYPTAENREDQTTSDARDGWKTAEECGNERKSKKKRNTNKRRKNYEWEKNWKIGEECGNETKNKTNWKTGEECGNETKNKTKRNTNNIATYSFVTIDVGVGFDFEICSTMQRTQNFTKYYFLAPPVHLQRGGQEYSEGGLRKSLRGGKEMLKGG